MNSDLFVEERSLIQCPLGSPLLEVSESIQLFNIKAKQ